MDTINLLRSAKKSASNLKQVQQEMLYEAADHNREALVRMLLKNGSDVNFSCRHRRFRYPLAIAAGKGHARIVRVLLQHGANMYI